MEFLDETLIFSCSANNTASLMPNANPRYIPSGNEDYFHRSRPNRQSSAFDGGSAYPPYTRGRNLQRAVAGDGFNSNRYSSYLPRVNTERAAGIHSSSLQSRVRFNARTAAVSQSYPLPPPMGSGDSDGVHVTADTLVQIFSGMLAPSATQNESSGSSFSDGLISQNMKIGIDSACSNQEICPICQDTEGANEEIGALNCGHLYHLKCIKKWLKIKNNCPLCRASVIPTSTA
ncbi:putative E3 ubiquitin-protein ligase RHA2B [Apostasia shenzhenica]|uniref:RING-type E3 ubiquitin transferase n=1 Tax=Apostasia shenzhenica TaxID=1088818 RepID=A0A2I0ALN7_9ASPA|nr:putative E3 ubiquitin-protein ligase RHA2B [Apostasia shenzhenica]